MWMIFHMHSNGQTQLSIVYRDIFLVKQKTKTKRTYRDVWHMIQKTSLGSVACFTYWRFVLQILVSFEYNFDNLQQSLYFKQIWN